MACGGEPASDASGDAAETEASRGADNQAPVLRSVEITPANPGSSDELSARANVFDADRDRLETTFRWMANGRVVAEGREASISATRFRRGDSISVEVIADDGQATARLTSDPVVLRNAVPEIRSVALTPATGVASTVFKVQVEADDADGDRFGLAYRWRVDGKLIDGQTSDQLPPGTAKRGQTVIAEVQADDGDGASSWVSTPGVRLENAAPEIKSQPVFTLSGPALYTYKVEASDPDGDKPLRFELEKAPSGMKIDYRGGEVRWEVPQDADGVFPVEVVVSDAVGGKTRQSYQLEVHWKAKPAEPAAPASGDSEEEL